MQILPPSTTKSIAARISQRTINLGEPRVAAEEGDGSRDIASTDIRHDADHGKTAVVELPAALLLQSLGVDAGEVELGEDDLGERPPRHRRGSSGRETRRRRPRIACRGSGCRRPGPCSRWWQAWQLGCV